MIVSASTYQIWKLGIHERDIRTFKEQLAVIISKQPCRSKMQDVECRNQEYKMQKVKDAEERKWHKNPCIPHKTFWNASCRGRQHRKVGQCGERGSMRTSTFHIEKYCYIQILYIYITYCDYEQIC
jgi:hypothetical protein